ncbi:F0F1 ATP synthase subunit gamma [Salipiger sp. P9]|uniref:F0F1 ATP synthase subunit gamma n=1 Tax=Salipiger pentaromativorans TaxID=2943193 RepID=UPI002157B943|nr:FoF1 ATP synthase subunit gamma [Salipiger pentaromativorans]MCR8549918.1 F0F1 ATP synthase subunit gamma [Salipiger pentaromativorans]
MSGRLADVEARIGTVHKLASVISAMRGIAAARAQEARQHVDSIRLFAETIGAAIGEALTLLPDTGTGAGDRARDGGGRGAVILLAAEQGFAGTYNEQVFDAAAPLLSAPHDLFIAGDRGGLVAAERGLPVAWSAAMIAHPAQAATLATRLTDAIFEPVAQGRITRVSIVHAAPGATGGLEMIARPLVPFDFSRFPAPAQGIAPEITLPPDKLLSRLVEEYVFAELSEAVVLAFAAENAARMRAMIAAHDNVMASLDTLVAASRRLRQEEITDEIVELATGRQPVRCHPGSPF